LLGYLFREGLAGEHGLRAPHTDAHLIAAWNGLDGLEPPRKAGGGRELGALTAALNAPLLAAGLSKQEWQQARPVYHLAISAAEQDRHLPDEQWADVVAEYVHRSAWRRAVATLGLRVGIYELRWTRWRLTLVRCSTLPGDRGSICAATFTPALPCAPSRGPWTRSNAAG
jgi:hypothetical protein